MAGLNYEQGKTTRTSTWVSACASVLALLLAACDPAPEADKVLTSDNVMAEAGSVRLMRDDWGIPHIYAETERDGYFGLGYALGEDRLTQVLLTYIIIQGRAAEVFGAGAPSAEETGLPPELLIGLQDTVASDLKMTQGRFLEDARANLTGLSDSYRTNVEAFAAGLRKYMADNPDQVPSWAPEIEPAMPLAVYAAFTSGNPAAVCTSKLEQDAQAALDLAEENPEMASNAWAVAPQRSATGEVIFSSDSHGGLMANGPMFYAWRLKAGDVDVMANDFTGSISMVLAHSNDFGWGWTEGPRYTGDCYAIKVNGDDPSKYSYDGQMKDITSVPYTIKVKGGEPVTGTFEYTEHNGVRSEVVKREGPVAYVASSSYSGRAGFADQQYYEMAKAKTGDEFLATLDAREIYPANLVAGGRDGTILYIRPGRIPVRKDEAFVHQILDGNSSTTAWVGFHPVEDMVMLRNPVPGYVANTNVSPDMMYPDKLLKAGDYPEYFAFKEGQINGRQRRIIELLDPARKLSFEDAIDIVLDTKIVGTDLWGPSLKDALRRHNPGFEGQSTAHGEFVANLVGFNGHFNTDSKGALYHVYFREALINTAPDQVDNIVTTAEGGNDLTSEQSLVVANAIEAAYGQLIADFGTSNIAFGDAHKIKRADISNRSGGAVIAVGKDLHNHRPLKLNGQQVSVRAALHANIYQRPENSKIRYLDAGVRAPFVVIFSDPLKSYGLLAFGQSNDPASPHYSDQMSLFTETKLKSNRFDFSDLKGHIKMDKVLQTVP